ncbi:hypothetical protein Q8A67_015653 [Cirrhinus molitorella]|uniref:Uncharacterized protein n=1 Tax=Cirrhinus molitorella TaxID=172907 RepID=A0AA88PTX0_9TELE|nr:hypothetical protein Q8A67_015653 [Cirrhinus molitorella]
MSEVKHFQPIKTRLAAGEEPGHVSVFTSQAPGRTLLRADVRLARHMIHRTRLSGMDFLNLMRCDGSAMPRLSPSLSPCGMASTHTYTDIR